MLRGEEQQTERARGATAAQIEILEMELLFVARCTAW